MEKFSLISNIATDVSRKEGKDKKSRLGVMEISPSVMLKKELSKYDISKLEDVSQKYEQYLKSKDVKILAAAIYMLEVVKSMSIRYSDEHLDKLGLTKQEIKIYNKKRTESQEKIERGLDLCIDIIMQDISADKANEVDKNKLILGIYSYYDYISQN